MKLENPEGSKPICAYDSLSAVDQTYRWSGPVVLQDPNHQYGYAEC